MNNLHLTLLFAGLCALLQCALTALVVARRLQSRVDLMDGGDAPLQRRIRAHGNFTETAPMALILIALLELRNVDSSWLWALGICLLLGRVLHAVGLLVDGAKIRIQARAHDHQLGIGRDLEAFCIRLPGGGTLLDCAKRICDVIRCAFLRRHFGAPLRLTLLCLLIERLLWESKCVSPWGYRL